MNARVKEKLVAALESGNYNKGKHYLRTADNTYCVYGVLTDLAVQAGLGTWQLGTADYDFNYTHVLNDEVLHAVPPIAVLEWAELDISNQLAYNGDRYTLMRLNDLFDLSFAEIAQLIRKQY